MLLTNTNHKKKKEQKERTAGKRLEFTESLKQSSILSVVHIFLPWFFSWFLLADKCWYFYLLNVSLPPPLGPMALNGDQMTKRVV